MEREPRLKKKDRTGVWVSIAVHVGAFAVILIILFTTKVGEDIRRGLIKAIRPETKTAPPPPPAPGPRASRRSSEAPPPPPTGGARRKVDAPASAGGGFAVEERTEKKGPSAAARETKAPPPPPPPPKPLPPLKLFSTAPAKSDIKQLLAERSKEAASVEAIGSEQISKTGASDAGAIIKNVSGATIVDGKYAVVRGLSDRYVTTTFNGAEIPSADPYRRAASLDLFPAQVIDKVVVAKTFTPDQQGAFTGGGINIVSKSFPERAFANVSVGGAYNTQATGNDNFLTYKGGSLDWLGIDDGTRALPSRLEDFNVRPPSVRYFTSGPRTAPDYQARIDSNDLLNELTELLGTAQFAPDREAPPLNHNFALAMGDTTHFFARPLGVFGSFNYKHDFNFYEDGISRRYEPSSGGEFQVKRDNTDTLALDTVNWSGMATVAYQYLPDHEVSFNFLHNQNGIDYVRQQVGTQRDDPGSTYFQNRIQWTERTLDTYQLRGTSLFPDFGGIKFDWLAVKSETSQLEPDARYFNYKENSGEFTTGSSGLPDPGNPTRYFRDLQEDNRNLKLDLTIPFRQWYEQEGLLKLGAFDSKSERSFTERAFYYPAEPQVFDGNPNNFLNPATLGYYNLRTNNATGRIAYDWGRYVQTFDSFYDAESSIRAAYFMLDFPLVPRLRLVGGLRLESTDLTVDSYSDVSIAGSRFGHSKIKQTDLLPAAGLIYAVQSNMNVRLHYSETVARPSFRELARYRSYDPILDVLLEGNPNLQMSAARNYDIRWEMFPRPGEIYSVSFYYKEIDAAIERIATDILADNITFINRDSSTVWGVEFEARKSLDFIHRDLRNWSIGGNFSYIKSETQLTEAEYQNKLPYVKDVSRTRPLYDQSPYILNLDLNYDNPRTGTSGSLVLNAAGPRIAIASPIAEDIYEHPPLTLDLILSQRIGRHLSLKFTARNLLDPVNERTYGKDSDQLYSSFHRGRTYGLSLSYDF